MSCRILATPVQLVKRGALKQPSRNIGEISYAWSGPDKTRQDRTDQNGIARNKTGPDRREPDRSGTDKTGQNSAGQDKTEQNMSVQDRTRKDKTGLELAEHDRIGQDRAREHTDPSDKHLVWEWC